MNGERAEFFCATFPRLSESNFRITSPRTAEYNCVAWVAGEKTRWWWPDPMNIYYWPPGVERRQVVGAFMEAFRTLGYRECSSGVKERGFEKIAIYADHAGVPVHLAKQLDTGNWSSKIGSLEDMEHDMEGLSGVSYGEIVIFMKREKGS